MKAINEHDNPEELDIPKSTRRAAERIEMMDGGKVTVDPWGEKYNYPSGRQYFVDLPSLIIHSDEKLEDFSTEFYAIIKRHNLSIQRR